MEYKCVSYPDFEPNHIWLRQMLLFVDEVHRIIPTDLERQDSDELKRLIDSCPQSVRSCHAQPYIEIGDHHGTTFGRALDQPKLIKLARSRKLTLLISPSGTVEVKGWEFLHVEKIGQVVRKELEKREMLRPSPVGDERWPIVPRGVAALIIGMIADQVAAKLGLDAITDLPLAFALNSLNQSSDPSSPLLEGLLASTLVSVQVPRDIGLLPIKKYVELRKRHASARAEFARMVQELKSSQRMSVQMSPIELRKRIDKIVVHVDEEIQRFRSSKEASTIKEWTPVFLKSMVPVGVGYLFGTVPGLISGGISLAISAVEKLTKTTSTFSYPKVLQTFGAANDAAAKAAIRQLTKR